MPIVNFSFDPERVSEDRINYITHMLRNAVARFITEADPEFGFSATEVTINCRRKGIYDLCEKDISIVIWANRYEERLKKMDETAEKISKAVSDAVQVTGVTNYVYLRYGDAGYHESVCL